MAKTNKTNKIAFRCYWAKLNEQERVNLRNQFIKLAESSYPTFYNKLRKNKFTALERQALEDIAGIQFDWVM